jgi:hypothetical protein
MLWQVSVFLLLCYGLLRAQCACMVFVLLAGLLDGARIEHVDMDPINALFSEVAKTGGHSMPVAAACARCITN